MEERRRRGPIGRWLGQVHRSSAGGRRGEPPALVLVSRRDCHLCDEMARLLDEVLASAGFSYETLDVDDDGDLLERFGDVVPVLLRDGEPVAKVRLHRRQLERILRRRR